MNFPEQKKLKFYLVRIICSFFPPILAQNIRSKLVSVEEARKADFNFRRRSFTGGYLRGNTKDFHGFKFFIHGYFDWRNIVLAKSILKLRKGNVIEVGANIGTETVCLAAINKSQKVYAFEPVPSNYLSLKNIKRENNFDNLYLFDLIVSDKPGFCQFKMPEITSSGSGHIIPEKSQNSQTIEMVSLDSLLLDLKSCSAILADVEGFEYYIIQGSVNIIKKFKPFLIIEVNSNFLKSRLNIEVDNLYKRILELQYIPFYIEKMGLKRIDESNFLSKHTKNWLCIPKTDLKYSNYLSRRIFINGVNPFINFKIF